MKRQTLLSALLLLAGCATPAPEKKPAPVAVQPPAPPPAPLPLPAGLDESAMDTSVNPCDDFYQYACGGWLKKTDIPADRAAWGRLAEIDDRVEQQLKAILEDASAGKLPAQTPYAQKLGDFYASCMDEAQLEQSLPQLQTQLKAVEALKSSKQLPALVGTLHKTDVRALFRFDSTQDFKDATQVIAEVDQGGLGLPDRDYYLKDDAKTKQVRDLYAQYVANMFTLLGDKPEEAKKKSDTVLELETQLAQASMSRVDRRDPNKLYHRLERKGLATSAPNFDWKIYFKSVGAPAGNALNVVHPPFFANLSSMVKSVPLPKWKTYLKWKVVSASIPGLPKRFQDENFAFTSKALTGAKADLPRWKKCVMWTNRGMGEALGRPFVERTFGAEGKATTLQLVKDIEASFEKNLDTLSWMDAPTKAKALEKVKAIANKIGYPDTWRNYDALQVDRASFLTSYANAQAFEQKRDLAKIGKPVDRSEWTMTPPTVNAYYNASLNEIVFPAGILQPPVFNQAAAMPVNYGAMGMVVGHETTHGFDDEGRQFDAQGNLAQWWTDASGKAFSEKAQCVAKQYSSELAVEDLHLNGELTLGENVADMGGLKLAFMAMNSYLAAHPETEKSRFTPQQQFFLGYAQAWCSKIRPETARVRVATDPHSPPFLRVNVPARNSVDFAQAFGCKEGAKMALPAAQRCVVW